MKIIKKLSEMIEEELEDAEKYARKALECKVERNDLAQVFHELSTQELRHVDMLHGEVVKLIEAHRREKGEPPPVMLGIYEYVHGRMIDHATRVRVMLESFRK